MSISTNAHNKTKDVVDAAASGGLSRTYELSEASNRQPAGSRHKLKQTDSLLIVHLLHHLHGHNSIIHGNTFPFCVCVC